MGAQGRPHKNPEEIQKESRGDPTRNWCLIDPLGMGILQESRGNPSWNPGRSCWVKGDPLGIEAGSPEETVGSQQESVSDPLGKVDPLGTGWIPWKSHWKTPGAAGIQIQQEQRGQTSPKTSFFFFFFLKFPFFQIFFGKKFI